MIENVSELNDLWNDTAYTLYGYDKTVGYLQSIDRDQAVDDKGRAVYDYYVLSQIVDKDTDVSDLSSFIFTAETMERYAEEW